MVSVVVIGAGPAGLTAAYIGGHRLFSKNKDIENLWSEWLEDEMISVPRMSRIL